MADIELVSCGGTLYLVTDHGGEEFWLEFQKSQLASRKTHLGTFKADVAEVAERKPARRARKKNS